MNNLFKFKNGKFVMSEGYGSILEAEKVDQNNVKLLMQLAKKIGADRDPELLSELIDAFYQIDTWGNNPKTNVSFDREQFALDQDELSDLFQKQKVQPLDPSKIGSAKGDANVAAAKKAISPVVEPTITKPEPYKRSPVKSSSQQTKTQGVRPAFTTGEFAKTSSSEEQEDSEQDD